MKYSLSVPGTVFFLTFFGCASHSTTEFQLFHEQVLALCEETTEAVHSAHQLASVNRIEAVAEGDTELLDGLVLQRQDAFTLTGDSTSLLWALAHTESRLAIETQHIVSYTLLLSVLLQPHGIALEAGENAAALYGTAGALVALAAEQGVAEHDAEKAVQAMGEAAPALDSMAASMAEITELTAEAVQAVYSDMAARRRLLVLSQQFAPDVVAELEELNGQTLALLSDLRKIHDAWLLVPVVHDELVQTVQNESTSATLRMLVERIRSGMTESR